MASKKKEKVLIVEDDIGISDVYKEYLETEGCLSVDVAKDGKEGLAKIKAEKYDLVLLDIVMPKLDGIGVLRELKKLKSKMPVILLTNLSDRDSIEEGRKLGVKDFVVKVDATPDNVLEKVERYL